MYVIYCNILNSTSEKITQEILQGQKRKKFLAAPFMRPKTNEESRLSITSFDQEVSVTAGHVGLGIGPVGLIDAVSAALDFLFNLILHLQQRDQFKL